MIFDFFLNTITINKRNKKNILFILTFALLLFLLFLDVFFIKNFNDYFDYAINKNIGFRTFGVYHESKEYKESFSEIINIDHISEMYEAKYMSLYAQTDLNLNDLSGVIELLYGTENIVPNSIIGKSMNELKAGEMICPYVFYPDSGAEELKIDEEKVTYADKLLNYKFNIYYNTYKISNNRTILDKEKESMQFKIVGLYDSALVMNTNRQCYITPEDMKELNDAINPKKEVNETYTHAYVVVDEEKNVKAVSDKLISLGFEISTDTISTIDEVLVNKLTLFSSAFFVVLIGIIFLLLINYVNKKLKEEQKQLGILRACGFSRLHIIIKELVENTTILFTSFMLCFLTFSFLFIILDKKLFKVVSYIGFKLSYNIRMFFLPFIAILIIYLLISTIVLQKSMKKSIINILKED